MPILEKLSKIVTFMTKVIFQTKVQFQILLTIHIHLDLISLHQHLNLRENHQQLWEKYSLYLSLYSKVYHLCRLLHWLLCNRLKKLSLGLGLLILLFSKDLILVEEIMKVLLTFKTYLQQVWQNLEVSQPTLE